MASESEEVLTHVEGKHTYLSYLASIQVTSESSLLPSVVHPHPSRSVPPDPVLQLPIFPAPPTAVERFNAKTLVRGKLESKQTMLAGNEQRHGVDTRPGEGQDSDIYFFDGFGMGSSLLDL